MIEVFTVRKGDEVRDGSGNYKCPKCKKYSVPLNSNKCPDCKCFLEWRIKDGKHD
jgi:hypothetical protein